MKEIELSRGYRAIVDDWRYADFNQHKRHAKCYPSGRVYAARNIPRPGGGQATLLLHNEILPVKLGFDVDHVNRNTLDNREENLRYATRSQNIGNSRKRRGASSGFKGVTWHKANAVWTAHVREEHLGCFESEEEAARAYDTKAREIFGSFAALNFPGEPGGIVSLFGGCRF